MLTLQELYEAYSKDIYRFAYWLSGNSADAEDITSETFVRAWFNYDSTKMETLKAYLMKIARNIYLETLRKNQDHAPLEDHLPDHQDHMETKIQRESELKSVWNSLQTLGEEDRTAFILRVDHDMSYAEIARVLKISEVAAKVKVHRVRRKLLEDRIRKEDNE
jgi:RNA polymerase sigma-70 factor (ECF subfamily)